MRSRELNRAVEVCYEPCVAKLAKEYFNKKDEGYKAGDCARDIVHEAAISVLEDSNLVFDTSDSGYLEACVSRIMYHRSVWKALYRRKRQGKRPYTESNFHHWYYEHEFYTEEAFSLIEFDNYIQSKPPSIAWYMSRVALGISDRDMYDDVGEYRVKILRRRAKKIMERDYARFK